jgi:hypothetical protein
VRRPLLAVCLMAAALTAIAAPADAQRPRPPIEGERPRDTTTAREPGDTIGAPGDTIDQEVEEPLDPAADSILNALRALEGYEATEYRGERAIYRAEERVLRLLVDPRVTRDGTQLAASDSIVFRDLQQMVEAYGDPKVSGGVQDLEGDILFYDLARNRATALGARTTVTEQATWFVGGDVTLEETERVYATSGTFTTDDRPEPAYHFRSDKIMVIRDRVLVARPARLYFGKVPVMWLPFIVHDLEQGRRSGLLAPEFSINDIVRTNSGYTREISNIGFYWAINEYMGAQLAGAWRSGTYKSLRGTTNWNWKRQFLNGNMSVQRYWEDSGSRTLALNGSSSWRPDERTSLSGTASYSSSSRFLRQVSTDPREVTQDLRSTLNVTRRFDWGNTAFGASRSQDVSDGSVTGEFPSFSISPRTITLFRNPSPDAASWYNNASLSVNLSGNRGFESGGADFDRLTQDEQALSLRGGLQQLSFGNLVLRATGTLNQRRLLAANGFNSGGAPVELEPESRDVADWQGGVSYNQSLIGATVVSPNIGLRQEIRRDSLTSGEYLAGPTRMNFGAGLSTAVFGFFPGVGPFSSIRHRLTPNLNYSYSPTVQQTARQDDVFGEASGRVQNRVSLSLNQSWEAKLRKPDPDERPGADEALDSAFAETFAADSAAAEAAGEEVVGEPEPAEAQKVTILSLTTSPLEYDFARAAEEGSGFVTERVANTITSDFLRGLSIRMAHDLFDRRELDPNDPTTRGELGRFSPMLSSLSTSFSLGPNSTVVRWIQAALGGIGGGPADGQGAGEGVMPGAEERDPVHPSGLGGATNNPRGTGGGPWNLSLDYRLSRSARSYRAGDIVDNEAVQTLGARMSFALTPNWAVNWNTDYSITDGEFGTHSLNLRRDLYRWEANFSYTLTPYGNSSFNMLVRLTDLPDLKFDYREPNLGIDDRNIRPPVQN